MATVQQIEDWFAATPRPCSACGASDWETLRPVPSTAPLGDQAAMVLDQGALDAMALTDLVRTRCRSCGTWVLIPLEWLDAQLPQLPA